MPASRPSRGFERLFVGDSEAERVPVLLNLFEEIAYHLRPERRDQAAPRCPYRPIQVSATLLFDDSPESQQVHTGFAEFMKFAASVLHQIPQVVGDWDVSFMGRREPPVSARIVPRYSAACPVLGAGMAWPAA